MRRPFVACASPQLVAMALCSNTGAVMASLRSSRFPAARRRKRASGFTAWNLQQRPSGLGVRFGMRPPGHSGTGSWTTSHLSVLTLAVQISAAQAACPSWWSGDDSVPLSLMLSSPMTAPPPAAGRALRRWSRG